MPGLWLAVCCLVRVRCPLGCQFSPMWSVPAEGDDYHNDDYHNYSDGHRHHEG